MRPMAESEGVLGVEEKTTTRCRNRNCDSTDVVCQKWDSSDGGYTDWKYTCRACGHVWWIDGPDA